MKTRLPLLALVCLSAGLLYEPSRVDGSADPENLDIPNGEFTFARVQFTSYSRGGGFGGGRGGGYGGRRGGGRTPGWMHDYPRADTHLLRILGEVTNIQTTPQSYVVVQLNSPEIMKYPFLYFSEPGTWAITPDEVENFREYLDRGGFAIFDDFDGSRDWQVFESCMKQVYPDRTFRHMDLADPIFHCFYDIETLDMIPPYNVRGRPEFLALRDDTGRIQAVANFNNDIGDFWEWSDESFYPIDLSNEAYKFGVNYVVYAMTH